MMNQVVIVGKINQVNYEEKNKIIMELRCDRHIKNKEGEYETDYLLIKVEGGIAATAKEHCRIEDIVGVKGRIERLEGTTDHVIAAEKMTFLSKGANK